jgi:5-methylcytosine-specific restriction protein A
MPTAPPRPCATPGCHRLVERPERYCPEHKLPRRQRKQSPGYQRPPWSWLYQTSRWRKLRGIHIKDHPQCVQCGEPGRIVDHITPHCGDEQLFNDSSNLQTLCWSCHERKHERGNRKSSSKGGGHRNPCSSDAQPAARESNARAGRSKSKPGVRIYTPGKGAPDGGEST